MHDLITHICQSAMMQAQLDALHPDWQFDGYKSTANDAPYTLDDRQAMIALTPVQSLNILNLAAAVRDAWHEDNGMDDHQPVHPEAMITMERARQADIATFTLKLAWDMRAQGDYDVWRAVLAGPLSDMADLFQSVMERTPLDPCVEDAMEAAFVHWYCDQDRVSQTDRDTLAMMDVVLDDTDEGDEIQLSLQAPRVISRAAIVQIGAQADTQLTYLSRIAHDLQNDPYFGGMDDTVNQTYLLHVIRDLETVRIHDVAFRDPQLAQRLFPQREFMAYS